MQKIFSNPSEVEKLAKEKYAIPQFLMMENAAKALADFILDFSPEHILILCGKGNNGGDGYAVARLLQNKCDITVLSLEPPAAEEAKTQYEMCQRLGITIEEQTTPPRWLSLSKPQSSGTQLILDCIYGTGFHGELHESVKQLLDEVNKSNAIKIACDIPSGLYFHADYTITMGTQKLSLYSDKAKAVCGKIIIADLGISRDKFESTVTERRRSDECIETSADLTYLIEPSDLRLPVRKDRAAHKGTYGHTTVFCGNKAGAAILTATAAMNFGSGLTTLLPAADSNLSQFQISPSLMISETIPKKTTAVSIGSGFTQFSSAATQQIKDWFASQKSPAAVFDAGILTAPEFPEFLKTLSAHDKARIILTPHLAEFVTLVKNLLEKECPVSELAENPQLKIQLGKEINQKYPNTVVIIKSANTFIAADEKCFIVADGPQSLAKGGSGDILAGLAVSLLAQGYSAKDAAITAAEHHALTARKIGEQAYNLTPEALLSHL